MAPDDELKKRTTRKLTKMRKEDHQVTMELPERFRNGDDADEDCTALHGNTYNMNQSVFGMIAAAGSQVDFNARFDAQSSDDEDDSGKPTRQSSEPQINKSHTDQTAGRLDEHRRKLSESKLVRSFARISSKSKTKSTNARGSCTPSPLSASPQESSTPELKSPQHQPREPPVMSRMLDARAELSSRPSFDMPRKSKDPEVDDNGEPSQDSLPERLMEIFKFESPEDVIEEYPCWLMKSVLLQGYMYITTKHICFYAYLPKKTNEVVKSGYLSKSGQRNPKFNRYWFRLKDDVLSYYKDPSDLYFPSGNIDLRYGISASVADKEKGKDSTHFTVETHQRKFNFKADSAPSAKEWVKSLQKIIFRSHNEGDSVKISLPIENIMDIEDSQIIEYADTCKIRIIDNDETYAIDEYFFSFFSNGKEALRVLKILVEDTIAQKIPEQLLSPRITAADSRGSSKRTSFQVSHKQKPHVPPLQTKAPALEEHVRATLSPLLSPRAGSPRTSTDMSRSNSDIFRRSLDINKFGRRSIDLNRFTGEGSTSPSANSASTRRSLSANRLNQEKRTSKQGSSDSYVHSLEEPGSSEAAPSASDETQASASQILRGSDVFLSPTIQRSPSAVRNKEKDDLQSPESRSLASPKKSIDVSPTRTQRPQHAATTGSISASNAGQVEITSGPSLQSLVKAGTYPLQRVSGFAGYLNRHSKRVSTLLATESMGYVEKVSGMWKGGKKHYEEPHGMPRDKDSPGIGDDDDNQDGATPADRFRGHFALPFDEKLHAAYFGYLHRVLPLYGKIYISDRSFCFRSLLPGSRTKVILPLKDIENVDKEKGFRFGYSGLVVTIRGHEEMFFEFNQAENRDDCAVTLLQNMDTTRYMQESGLLSMNERESAEMASAEHKALQQARREPHSEHDMSMSRAFDGGSPPISFDDPRASILNFKPTESLRITCLTIGSRGDVQPYIALCKGLMAEGHKTRIATHLEFKDWIESHGIAFAPVDGDPAELMRICVENGMFTYSFLREANSTFRFWVDDLLSSAWKACQDSDILIESPSAMAGIHIAEALRIPYFRAFTMPWTRTRAYPHAFAVPEHKMGGAYNYITYVMFDNIFWKAISGQVNRWRKHELGLQATSLEKMQPNKVPFLYNFSPSVVVPPLDYSDWIRVTGYWFLDEGSEYTPPKDLTDFIKKARADGKRLVYVGFGSIVVADSAVLTQTVVASVLKADVRCILSKGWSDRLDKKGANDVEVPLPPEIFQIKSAPHDWLFSQIDAAAHHGGSGTTGASLRAGIPTIIRPFFGDQFFFGQRVEDLGVGIHLKKINVSVFSRALWEASNSERMIIKAKVLGEQIRKENGVDTAIQCIYRDMEYAKSLIKGKEGKSVDDTLEDTEESWTFIGDDNDPELIKRIHDWEPMAHSGTLSDKNAMTWSGSDAASRTLSPVRRAA
ncbi:Sterol 3-beta-glucosyltransferase [Ciborinia camelliae]|nr:Sterol 3-beta-glucosyltransferase [Ciborinia camelliae]